MEFYKYKIKIYDANNNAVVINWYNNLEENTPLGYWYGGDEEFQLRGFNVTWLDGVFFNFNFEKNTNTSANPCSVNIQGLDADIKDKIKEIGKKYYGDKKKTLRAITWQGPVNKGETGKYEYTTVIPTLSGVKSTTTKPDLDNKNVTYYYKEFGWGKIQIWGINDDGDNVHLYTGDIITMTDDEDNLNIEAGTSHYFLSLPYNQRIFKQSTVDSFIVNYEMSRIKMNQPSKITINYSPEHYWKILINILNSITDPEDEDIDIFNETKLFNYIKLTEFESGGKFNNDYYETLLHKIVDKNKKDLSILDVTAVDGSSKKITNDAEGNPIYINGYYFLKGSIEEVINKLTSTSLIICYCDNDIYKIFPYFETNNKKELANFYQFKELYDEYEKNYYLYEPIGSYVKDETDETDVDTRVTFVTDTRKLDEIELANGIGILNGETTEIDYVYIDTITVNGDSNSATVNFSGRTTNFDWRT